MLDEGGVIRGVTVGDIRQAADGDDARGQRLAIGVQALCSGPSHYLGMEIMPQPTSGPGTASECWKFGWPFQWLVFKRSFDYRDLLTLSGRGPAPRFWSGIGVNPMGWAWFRPSATVRWSGSGTGGSSIYLQARLFLALALAGTAIGLVVLGGFLRHRTRTRVVFGVFAVAALGVLGLPDHQVTLQPRPRFIAGYAPLTVGAIRDLSRSKDGRREIAMRVNQLLGPCEADAHVSVYWAFDEPATCETWAIGWPTMWLGRATVRPNQPPAGTPDQRESVWLWKEGCISWVRCDTAGNQNSIRLNADQLAESLSLPGLLYIAPIAAWSFCRGRRARRWLREGRCLTCGYEVGAAVP